MTNRTPEGDQFGYVGHILDPDWSAEAKPADPLEFPRAEGQSEFPKPGVYFGLDEEFYHSVPAVSSSGLKHMAVSSMDYWARSRLNPDHEEQASRFLDHGRAVHCLVLEGEEQYARRYAVALDPSDFKDALVSTDQVKAAISAFTEVAPVTPVSGTKQELIDQLAALGREHGRVVDLEGTIPDLKTRIRSFEVEQPVVPVSRVAFEDGGKASSRAAVKADWIDQLLALNPDAKVWDRLVEEHLSANEGKTIIEAKDDRLVRIAAKMMLDHPEIGQALSGGHAEVSIFWHCRETGLPMKARIDRWKLRLIVDLKTFSNKQGKPVNQAIATSIASYRYNVQHAVYLEAVREAKRMVREHGATVVHGNPSELTFAQNAARIEEDPAFLFVFQQSGIAPVTRGKLMPVGTVYSVTQSRVRALKEQFAECITTYGSDPWLDLEDIDELADEQIPTYATELGKVF